MTGHSATILVEPHVDIPPVGCHHRPVQHWRLPSQPLRSVNVCFVTKAGKLSGKGFPGAISSATKLRKAALLSLGPKGAPGEHQMSSLLLVPPFNTRPFVERPATLKYVKRIQQMMLPKPLNFTLQLRPSPPPSCWDVRSNEGHDVVHLKPLGTWPLRILRYSNTSRVSRFQHGISPSQTEIKETNQQVQVG